MFVSDTEIDKATTRDRQLETKEFTVYWRGFAYVDGLCAGGPSITRFATEAVSDLPGATARLKGNYFVAIADKRTGTHYAFVDNSAMFQAFHSDRFVSTSFLDLVAAEQVRASDIDPEALVEFFHFGNIYFGRTFFTSIRKLDPEHILCLKGGQKLTTIPKPVPSIASPPSQSFVEFLGSFAKAASREKLSVDLSGGHDSRLLVVVLHHLGIPFELVTSGDDEIPDVIIAREVASVLKREHHCVRHDATCLEPSLPKLFAATEGLCDVVRCHRAYEVQKDRVARGVSLIVSGAAGELLREHWWLQDFPFYNRRAPRLGRLYDFRFCPMALNHSLLMGPYREASETYRTRTLQQLTSFIMPGNTQTYDNIVYGFRMREYAGRFLSNYRDLLQWYAPYLERDAVRVGYNLPRWQRFFNGFHRQTMTLLNPAAARIRTTEGEMSISSEAGSIVRDLSKYVGNRMSRLACKISQRTGYKRPTAGAGQLRTSPDDARLRSMVRELPQAQAGLRRLKDSGILSPATQIAELSNTQVGTVLTLGLLFDFLEQSSARRIAVLSAA